MKLFRFLPFLAAVPMLFTSCADEKGVNNETIERNLLDAYMVVNYDDNGIPRPAQADLGYYYIPLKSGGSTDVPREEQWIRYDYTITKQDGTVVTTSSADVAKVNNFFSYFTHFAPNYSLFEAIKANTSKGVADAMKNHMKSGDSIRLILPPFLAGTFTPSNNPGKPVIIDVAVRDVVPSPVSREQSDLLAYVNANFSATTVDTVGLYIGELIPYSGTDKLDTIILKDGYTIEFLYTGKFIDGYMFETNVADTAKAHDVYVFGEYKKLSCKLGEDDKNYPKGLIRALKKMKVGSTSVTLFTSEWSKGASGAIPQYNSSTGKYTQGGGINQAAVVKPYESMMYYIEILSVNKNEK